MKLAVAAHLLLACLVPVGATALRASEVAARAWLRDHPARTESEDELAELKTENPDAYAIVKSLLMKKSLGLLDPKHPSASFAKTPTSDSAAEETIAPVESESAVTMPSPDGSATAASSEGTHKDWLNWKPQDSAANDEAMVHSVLGAVAQIKGGQSTDAVQGAPQSSATRDTSASLEWKDPSSDTMPAAEPPVVPVAQPAAEAPEPAKPVKHSQLLGSTNYLKSFSWGDDDHQPKTVAAPPKPALGEEYAAPAVTAAPHTGALLAWLGGGSAQVTASKVAVSTQSPQPQNPYSAFLA